MAVQVDTSDLGDAATVPCRLCYAAAVCDRRMRAIHFIALNVGQENISGRLSSGRLDYTFLYHIMPKMHYVHL